MKNRILKNLKKIMVIMMACMLLTVVSSNADLGIMPCGGKIESDYIELE